MKRVGTNVLPTQPTLALATDGPYRFTRNPLYIAAIGVYLGITFWVDGLALLLLLFPMAWVLHRGIVLPEERYLESKFGERYLVYRSAVRRWL
ncbi:MAG: isoprenylcysteine carboxylmethyltransferase family protein [Gemmatimonadaceae bacterium]